MFSKGFILSLGLSLCSVVLVYLYVKNRINNLENKVDKLIQVIQLFQQQSYQMGGVQENEYEKIVVSDDEDDEEDSDEESSEEEHEEEEQENHVVEQVEETVEQVDDNVSIKEEVEEAVEQQMLKLSKGGEDELLEMEEHIVTPDDGLDDMDDLDEDLEEDVEEEVDYSKMGKVQLRELCETKGFDVKGKKKHELIELLK
jgi:hypothetical protein